MKFDYVIYARGTGDRDDYALRHAPAYFPAQMSGLLAGCLDAVRRTAGRVADDPAAVSDQLRQSLIWLDCPAQRVCLLLRVCAPIRDRAAGAVWTDAAGRQLWVTEGLCCEWDDRRYFLLLLPSLMQALTRQEQTLLQKHYSDVLTPGAAARHPAQTDIPDTDLINPMQTDGQYPESGFSPDGSDETRRGVRQLCDLICRTGDVPEFAFGPAAELLRSALPQRLGTVFPRADAYSAAPDLLGTYPVQQPRADIETRHTVLQCCFEPEDGTLVYQWAISNDIASHEGDILLASPAMELKTAEGIRLTRLETEAEYLRALAVRMQWEPGREPALLHDYYRFLGEV